VSGRPEMLLPGADLVLTAGAGAGKTTALVELYVGLIQGRVGGLGRLRCTDLLALTYTEKAAQEMRWRIRQELAGLGLSQELERLERAPVGTIHGFCAGLLREFALEAGLDPDFGILTERSLLAETAVEFLIEALDRGDPDLETLLRFLPFQGPSGLAVNLSSSLALARSMGQPPARLAEGLVKEGRELPRLRRELAAEYGRVMSELARLVGQGGLNPKAKSTPVLEEVAAQADRPLDRDRAAWLREKMKGHQPRAVGPLKERLLALLDDFDRLALEPQGLEAAGALVRLMDGLQARYDEAKSSRQALDFDDLQLLVRRILFQRTDLRQRLKERTRLILVDEFQDTNPLQWQIINCLRERLDQAQPLEEGQDPAQVLDLEPGKLIVVGDAKQSIYRFRGAEVGVFTGLVRRADNGLGCRAASLDCNWRSQPGLVEFYNNFFDVFIGQGDKDFEVNFNSADRQARGRQGRAQGLVEFLESRAGDQTPASRELEARAVAWRIKELVEVGSPVPIGSPGKDRAEWGDVAVLLRKLTQVAPLEAALRRLSIPYQLVRAQGGQDSPEVRDLVNLLCYLTRPFDLFLLVSLLRSPLAGLSDESLFLMAQAGGIDRFAGPSAKDGPAPLPTDEAARLNEFNRLIRDLSAWRDRLPPAELIELALERSDLAAVYLAGFQGRQKLAQAQALIESLRRLAAPGVSLFDLVEQLRPPDGRPGVELDPPLIGGLNAVQVMTIHKAKGLQFPVVILAQSGQSERGPAPPAVLIRPGLGLGVKLRNLDTGQWGETWSYRRLREQEDERDRAESKRLLYVALTRAQDLLIISGPGPTERQLETGSTWRAALEGFALAGGLEAGLIRRLEGREEIPDFETDLPAGFDPTGEGEPSPEIRAEATRLAARILEPPRPPARLVISVSALEDLALCPRLFLRRRLLLEPADYARPKPAPSTPDRVLDPTQRGQWLHKILERIDFAAPDQTAGLVEAAAGSLLFRPSVQEKEEMAGLVDLFLASPLGRRLAGLTGAGLSREVPFSLQVPVQGGVLQVNGEIDLLARAGERPWLMDYKLGRPRPGLDYSFQLMTYGLAVTRTFSRPGLTLVYLNQDGLLEKEIPFGPAEEELIARRLEELADRLLAAGSSLEPADWPARPQGPAEACPFRGGGCPCG